MIEFKEIWKCDYCNKENVLQVRKIRLECSTNKSMYPKNSIVLDIIDKHHGHTFCNQECLLHWLVEKGTAVAFADPKIEEKIEENDVPF